MIRLALTYGAVASTGAAAWVGWGQGQGELAGAIILAALAFFACRFWILGGVDLGARLPRRDTVASILLVGMIVTAGVAGPLAQPAVAAEAGNCSDMDDFVMFLTIGVVNGDDCSRQAYVDAALEDYQRVEAQQTKVDIYSSLSETTQQSETFQTSYDNYLTDTETVAWSKMQVAVAESYQNGSTKTQAQFEAEKAIEQYYSIKERNLIAHWNGVVSEVEYSHDIITNSSNVSNTYVYYEHETDTDTYQQELEFATTTKTLSNGTSVTVKQMGGGTTTYGLTQNPNNLATLYVAKPTSNYDSRMSWNHSDFADRWNRIQTKRNSLINESDLYINATYDSYQDGTVNASDVISSQTAMFEYGTRSGDTNESLYDTVGALALAGYDTPSLNGTGTMDVSYNNQTYSGLVMARTVPGGSWTNGTTYNTSNFDGPVFITTTDGQKIDLPASGAEFTVEAIRAQDGSSISSVNTTRYNYKTSNATELLEVQEELTALRTELEEREPDGGSGGGIGGIGDSKAIIAIIAGVAVLLLTRD